MLNRGNPVLAEYEGWRVWTNTLGETQICIEYHLSTMTTTVLREGTFFSESHVIEGFVKKRYMVLERTHGGKDGAEGAVRIIVFDSKQIADRNLYAQPGFSSPFVHVWNLESGMKVTEVENKGFRMRDQTSRARRKEFVVVPLVR